jgi:flagellar hook assembly protein FlgD
VTGAIGQALPQLSLSQLRVQPGVVTPNGDGVGDTARITYLLGASASVTVTLADASGTPLASLWSGVMSQGAHSFSWNQIGVPDGRYQITISARAPNGKQASATATLYVDRTLALTKLAPAAISPNGDGLFDATALSFSLNAAAAVRVELWRAGKLVGAIFDQSLGIGPVEVPWDGRIAGNVVADGTYDVLVKATDSVTTVSQKLRVAVDTTPPRLRLVSRAKLRFWVSEAGKVTALFGGRRVVKSVARGFFGLPLLRGARHFSLIATDLLGNKSLVLRR